jgi:hypothetical protein
MILIAIITAASERPSHLAAEALRKARASRFDSPQFLQKVSASEDRFRFLGIARSFNGLAAAKVVCGDNLPAISPLPGQTSYCVGIHLAVIMQM